MKRFLLAAAAALVLGAGVAEAQTVNNPPSWLPSLSVAPQTATYTVGPTGNFATVTAAMMFLNQQVLPQGGFVTLTVQDGVISEPAALLWSSPFAKQINVQGQHTYSFTLSSIQSSSGSAGAWTYVLNLNSGTNIAVGDYLTIYGTSGGTNPTYVAGVWPVTAVSGSQVTVTTTGHQSAAASGSVAGTVVDMKSTLKFTNSDGFDVWSGGSTLNITNVNIVGDGTSHNGISVQDVGRVYVANYLSVSGFGGDNILSLYNSEMNGAVMVLSGGGNGVFAETGGSVDAITLVASGNSTNGVDGVSGGVVTYQSSGLSSGNGVDGFYATAGGAVRPSGGVPTYATGNAGYGLFADQQGILQLSTLTSQNNGNPDQLQFYSTHGFLSGGIAVGGSNSCSGAGTFAWITDSTMAYGSSTRGANITGGGSNGVAAYCDGAHWDFM